MIEMPKAVHVVRFGGFEINLHSRELRKQGLRLRLESKPFQILELLLEHAGEVVTRRTLCEKLWPDTYVGFEHSLNTAVNKLRGILCDFAQNPRFVETLPRLGYRFIAPVQRPDSARPRETSGTGVWHDATPARCEEEAVGQVKAKPVPRSSRPPRVPAMPLQAKILQTAR